MSDPRLDGHHLSVSRYDLYEAAVDELLDARGRFTADFDLLARLPAVRRDPTARATARREQPPPGGTYTLVGVADGRRHVLRTGMNALGRARENDFILTPIEVSRRHCVVVVHAAGGCEVFDTASRNGTYVNRRRVRRTELYPGDVLALSHHCFLVAWAGAEGERPPADAPTETSLDGWSPDGLTHDPG